MTSAREVLDNVRTELRPAESDNRLVDLVAEGKAPRSIFAMIAAEEYRIVHSDWRSFLELAARATDSVTREFFSGLAQGESIALGKVRELAHSVGLDEDALLTYEPNPGCQAYPAFVAWLAINSEPADAVVAMVSNFAAWGSYCATVAKGMRAHYGFDDSACGFFDLFATPAPGADEQAEAAVQAGIDAGRLTPAAHQYGRLFQHYELMFWNTVADTK